MFSIGCHTSLKTLAVQPQRTRSARICRGKFRYSVLIKSLYFSDILWLYHSNTIIITQFQGRIADPIIPSCFKIWHYTKACKVLRDLKTKTAHIPTTYTSFGKYILLRQESTRYSNYEFGRKIKITLGVTSTKKKYKIIRSDKKHICKINSIRHMKDSPICLFFFLYRIVIFGQYTSFYLGSTSIYCE
jgi:hypothetical protein